MIYFGFIKEFSYLKKNFSSTYRKRFKKLGEKIIFIVFKKSKNNLLVKSNYAFFNSYLFLL